MRHRLVLRVLGNMILIVCLGLLVTLGVALWQKGPATETWALIASVLITLVAGVLLRYLPRRGGEERFGNREAFAVVTFGWISVTLVGALPFYLSGVTETYTDAFFETMSGFTTTGATILTNIESVPKGILFWRSLTHWFGGMGIVVLSVAVLPSLGAGGFQLFMAEMPGIKGEKLRPRIAETAKLLWKVYLLLTCSQVALLLIGDMPLFDSICHAFGTVATAGFSTKNASIGNET
ncbi:MAG: TrkH family potassium uptake protein, partial [Planctomycetota bacterium]|nr:TrkH family potassium uptake protein [Planctomycetota bacterium]